MTSPPAHHPVLPSCYVRRIVVLSALALALGACSGSGADSGKPGGAGSGAPSPSATASSATIAPGPAASPLAGGGNCQEVPPDTGLEFSWLPKDLPLPPGTYPVQQLQKAPGIVFDSGLLATPLSLDEFAKFADREWKPLGYILGSRDAEAGEKEATFLKDDRYGSYRVRPYCGEKWSELYLGYGSATEPTIGTRAPGSP